MAQNVIGRKVKARHPEFDELLCHYDSLKLLARWGIDGEDAVYDALILAGIAPQPNGANAVLWRTFSRSIIGSAHFLADYKYNDLKRDIDTKNTLAVLGGGVQLIASAVPGYGFALAADVLRKCGMIDSVKPDTHIKKFAKLIGIKYRSDADLLIRMNKFCQDDDVSPYKLDKRVWLVYSSNFYRHLDLRRKIRIDVGSWENLVHMRNRESF